MNKLKSVVLSLRSFITQHLVGGVSLGSYHITGTGSTDLGKGSQKISPLAEGFLLLSSTQKWQL